MGNVNGNKWQAALGRQSHSMRRLAPPAIGVAARQATTDQQNNETEKFQEP
jgi:hypothetical protein